MNNSRNAVFVARRSGGDADGTWGVVGKLEHDSHVYRYVYTEGARVLAGFRAFPGMPDLDQVYESDQLFPVFANRLLAKSRPEYDAYLTWSGFDPANPPDPLAILAVTEGIAQTDFLEVFPCPSRDEGSHFTTKFFLHGLRHATPEAIEQTNRLKVDESLLLEFEDDNPRDPRAVAIWVDKKGERHRIGYVPRYLSRDVRTLAAKCPESAPQLHVERINPSAPFQMRVLCHMTADWPEEFRSCASDEYRPIVGGTSLT